MGLLDSLIGNLGGSGGPSGGSSATGTSPVVKAILLLLAAKAAQGMTSRSGDAHTGNISGSAEGAGGLLGGLLGGQSDGVGSGLGSGMGGNPGGGLGGLLSGGLGGLLGGLTGGAAGGGLLGGLLEQLRGRGFGDQVDSWVGPGQNQHIPPSEMARALGPDALTELEQHTGLPRDQLLDELSHELPESVDRMTPGGRVPSDDEIWSGVKS